MDALLTLSANQWIAFTSSPCHQWWARSFLRLACDSKSAFYSALRRAVTVCRVWLPFENWISRESAKANDKMVRFETSCSSRDVISSRLRTCVRAKPKCKQIGAPNKGRAAQSAAFTAPIILDDVNAFFLARSFIISCSFCFPCPAFFVVVSFSV